MLNLTLTLKQKSTILTCKTKSNIVKLKSIVHSFSLFDASRDSSQLHEIYILWQHLLWAFQRMYKGWPGSWCNFLLSHNICIRTYLLSSDIQWRGIWVVIKTIINDSYVIKGLWIFTKSPYSFIRVRNMHKREKSTENDRFVCTWYWSWETDSLSDAGSSPGESPGKSILVQLILRAPETYESKSSSMSVQEPPLCACFFFFWGGCPQWYIPRSGLYEALFLVFFSKVHIVSKLVGPVNILTNSECSPHIYTNTGFCYFGVSSVMSLV